MTGSPFPPDYIKLPPSIACADEDDALIVTMARILGLCWARKYRRSPPYTPDQLSGLLGRPRTSLYRHLNKLQDLGWLSVDRADRKLVLQPCIPITEHHSPAILEPDQSSAQRYPPEANSSQELRGVLQEAGIIGRPFRELLERNVNPVVVQAWYLWTWAQEQEWMENPAGYIVNRLREGDEPPDEFLELATLSPDETARIRDAWCGSEQFTGWPSLDSHARLQNLAPLWMTVQSAMRRCRT